MPTLSVLSSRAWGRLLSPRWALLLLVVALGLALLACSSAADRPGAVHVLTARGVVNPVLERYIDRGIGQAEEKGAAAVVIRLDTPGGLVTSMEEIVKRILSAQVPVIVYVSPAGAQAASAGTFITMAGHVAAMAETTRIGAASPVGAGGEDIEGTLGEKATNDLVSLIKGLAAQRGRNAEWAEQAVRQAVSATGDEALALKVVDLVAPDLTALLQAVDGRQVALSGDRLVTLHTASASVDFDAMNPFERFLSVISDPNIAFVLLSLGALALIFEFLNPGAILPGVVGVLALIVAFFSLGTLPVNWAGVALILVAFGLFALEVFVTSYGILTIGGIVALILGGSILLSSSSPGISLSPWLIYGTAAGVATFFLFVISAIFRSRRLPVAVGVSSIIGRDAVVRSTLDPGGYVLTNGELWSAVSEDGRVDVGERVIVTSIEGLKLRVRRKKEGV